MGFMSVSRTFGLWAALACLQTAGMANAQSALEHALHTEPEVMRHRGQTLSAWIDRFSGPQQTSNGLVSDSAVEMAESPEIYFNEVGVPSNPEVFGAPACNGCWCGEDGCTNCGGPGGALCLWGGHDVPYDFAQDALDVCPESSFDVGGWTQFGYTTRSTGQFNDNPNRLRNHQTWLFMEKTVDGSLGIDWGFRVDVMYGVDANDTQAFGNNPGEWDFENGFDHGIYGFALPQFYGEVAYGQFSMKFGHFFTLLGYEVIPAPGNFFFSHSLTMYHSEAFTHSGFVATYEYDDDITLYAGWTEGWDTAFDQFDGGSSFLGGTSMRLTQDSTLAYILTFGNFGKFSDGYSHSIVLDVALTNDLNYIFQSDLLEAGDSESYGINQYLLYDINEWLAVGTRAEWWKSDGTSYYEITGGFNIRPSGNFVVRPEVRYQYSPAGKSTSGMFTPENPAGLPVNEGAIFGIDAILTF